MFKQTHYLLNPLLCRCRPQGSETTIFPCECWLARSEDDGETVRELVPSDIITEKLARDGSLKVTEIEVEDALESKLKWLIYADAYADIYRYTGDRGQCSGARWLLV